MKSGPISSRTALLGFFALISALFFAMKTVFPEVSLTAQSRREKRLQFNEYYEKELAQLTQEAPPEPAEKFWSLSAGASYGYDSNATVAPSRTSDHFTEGTLDFSTAFDHGALGPWLGPGPFGFEASGDFVTYHEETESDYVDAALVSFVSFGLGEAFRLREEYTFGYTRYLQEEDLRYLTHGVKSTLTQTLTPRLEHALYFDFQFKDFTDRNALASDNTELSKNRDDLYHEVGYSLRLQEGGTAFGMTGAWKRNRSNDNFQDFNDYRGWKLTGYAYQEWSKLFSFIFLTGYDFKRYDHRSFGGGEGVERDHYFYLSPSLYVNLSESTAVVCSYLYTRNASNDADQAYFGHTVTIGLSATL